MVWRELQLPPSSFNFHLRSRWKRPCWAVGRKHRLRKKWKIYWHCSVQVVSSKVVVDYCKVHNWHKSTEDLPVFFLVCVSEERFRPKDLIKKVIKVSMEWMELVSRKVEIALNGKSIQEDVQLDCECPYGQQNYLGERWQ